MKSKKKPMTPEEAYNKCLKEKRRILELEELISTDSLYSYQYARDIIKGRWEKGEEVISKFKGYSYRYSVDVLKTPFELGENIISKNPEFSYWYTLHAIKGPFEKCHSVIFNSEYKNDYLNFLKSIDYDMTKISEWLL